MAEEITVADSTLLSEDKNLITVLIQILQEKSPSGWEEKIKLFKNLVEKSKQSTLSKDDKEVMKLKQMCILTFNQHIDENNPEDFYKQAIDDLLTPQITHNNPIINFFTCLDKSYIDYKEYLDKFELDLHVVVIVEVTLQVIKNFCAHKADKKSEVNRVALEKESILEKQKNRIEELKPILNFLKLDNKIYKKLSKSPAKVLFIKKIFSEINSCSNEEKTKFIHDLANDNFNSFDDYTLIIRYPGKDFWNFFQKDDYYIELINKVPGKNLNAIIEKIKIELQKMPKQNQIKLIKKLEEQYFPNFLICISIMHYALFKQNNNLNMFISFIKNISRINIENRAGINQVDMQGISLLHCAAYIGSKEMAILLIKYGANLNQKDRNDISPIHCALFYAHIEFAKLLIQEGADVQEPFYTAVQKGHKNTANFLIQHNADVNHAVYVAASQGHTEIIKLLLENYGASKNNIFALFIALKNNYPDTAIYLIQKGIDINNALYIAVREGYKSIAHFLIEQGANVNYSLTMIVKNVINHYFYNAPGYNTLTILHVAIMHGHYSIAELLLKHGAKCNATDIYNNTPLHFTIIYRRVKITKLLLDNNADVTIKNIYGNNSLHLACASGNKKIVWLLIKKYKIDINIPGSHHCTPLHFAVMHGHYNIVVRLLRNKANYNAQDIYNNNPLHLACMAGNEDIVKLLLDYNADTTAINNISETPLSIAINNQNNAIIKLFHDHFIKFQSLTNSSRNIFRMFTLPPYHPEREEKQQYQIPDDSQSVSGYLPTTPK